ncbi:tRNA pseudouridine(13) synthase TruD [Vibrio breoganii]|uniref:tRNA pseudouridine(13) synthase TruD n=1 Tax=Vibrio breoganii TaxID=553239 RepID=UPI0003169357|nr:tRNA pseudouridine(13) synthase TruD [Vibrio breoganii]OED87826.1 tRNA pseudouridine(13) synthase TruD [Vibrio breoganii ZF-55]PMK17076.1 tRNA pseudouridine(13) synthase TruD [Vibrio breoganii]PMK46612.1 tRNA pseudouridine(13) synthase TruD [Vibrio breoganii]PML08076.1 tRNA pseudouridine(13) synthase TruD [Vibrio breoganii]PMM88301.1 tRNA pseudouridine(13) synthase TruD [Vibrio breoganii]
MSDILSNLAYQHGKPTAKAKLKAKAEHFVVKEDLGFELLGTGEHLMLRVRKTGENTSFVANELAKFCGVKSKDVSWAGLKDRHAVTEQWLSVHLPKNDDLDFALFTKMHPSVEILEITRHNKKLRPGDLKGNFFELTLSEVTDVMAVEARLQAILESGVPNYFGAQRFGNNGNNLDEARRWGRDNVRTRNQNKRSLYLSTARSWIFNQIVSERLNQECFDSVIAGDVLSESGEITAALAGDNALPTSDTALEIEQAAVDAEPDLMALIRGNRMRHDRRAIKLLPEQLSWESSYDEVVVKFWLDSGCFATSIMREVIEEIPFERSFD